MPHRQSIKARALGVCAVLCVLTWGCAAPRTFVHEPERKKPGRAHVSSAEVEHKPAAVPHKSAPNHPEPSVWSKWMEAFVPAKSKPVPRIPLPRTDLESEAPFPSANLSSD